MKRNILIFVIASSLLSFGAGYYVAYKRTMLTDEDLNKFFDDSVGQLYIDSFYQVEIYTTYRIAKILKPIRENKTINAEDIDNLESLLNNNVELFDKTYAEHPDGGDLPDSVKKQLDFIKLYRNEYLQE